VPTATPTLAPGATPKPKATPTPSADEPEPGEAIADEPAVFPALTNGSFEEVREDGTPYAWRKVGGEIAATDTASVDGSLSLQLVSATTATKWAHQAVAVTPGKAYEFAGFAAAGPGAMDVFLRVSWYAAADGSGQALASDDSPSVDAASAAFQHVSTGALAAPDGARSARLRLMLRPSGSGAAAAYFDALSFGPASGTGGGSAAGSGGVPGGAPGGEAAGERPAVAGAAATPFDVVNMTPVPAAKSVLGGGDGDGTTLVWFLGSLAVPVVGLAVIGAIEFGRRRQGSGD
jgi:hypothetical protein